MKKLSFTSQHDNRNDASDYRLFWTPTTSTKVRVKLLIKKLT